MNRVQKKMEHWESMAVNVRDRRVSDSVKRTEWSKLQQTKEVKATVNRKTVIDSISKDLSETKKKWV